MCEFDKKRGTFRIDPCMINFIKEINSNINFKTILCCCGHGIYKKTIIVKNIQTKEVFEWFSLKKLPGKNKKGNVKKRYYKRDSEGYFYLPASLFLQDLFEK